MSKRKPKARGTQTEGARSKAKGGTVHIGPDFYGLKDAEGKVIVDDTAFFKAREREEPIRALLNGDSRVEELRERLSGHLERLRETDPELARDISLVHGWLEQVTIGLFANMLEAERAPECPACRTGRVIPIIWGEPMAYLGERAERGEVILAGCCIGPDSMKWHCRGCGHEFGRLGYVKR